MTNCIFEPRTDTSSATICKNCGQEKVLHNHNRQVPQLYTEEQLSKILMKFMLFPYKPTEPKRSLVKRFIKSLKQPKKD
jgi:hypothetical protein